MHTTLTTMGSHTVAFAKQYRERDAIRPGRTQLRWWSRATRRL